MKSLYLWVIVTVAVGLLATVAMLGGFQVPELTVEIVGSLTGVFLALGCAEIIRLEIDARKGSRLKRNLIEELLVVRQQLESGAVGYAFECPIWTLAKNTGMLQLLDHDDMLLILKGYAGIDALNQDTRLLDMMVASEGLEKKQQIIQHRAYMSGVVLRIFGEILPRFEKKA